MTPSPQCSRVISSCPSPAQRRWQWERGFGLRHVGEKVSGRSVTKGRAGGGQLLWVRAAVVLSVESLKTTKLTKISLHLTTLHW